MGTLQMAPGYRNPRRRPTRDTTGRPHREAAGFVLESADGSMVLVTLRAGWLEFGETWSIPGGLLEPWETPLEGALRETCEELGLTAEVLADAIWDIRVLRQAPKPGRGGYFTTFIARCDLELDEITLDRETLDVAWVPRSRLRGLDLHPGFEATLQAEARRRHPAGKGRKGRDRRS